MSFLKVYMNFKYVKKTCLYYIENNLKSKKIKEIKTKSIIKQQIQNTPIKN